jgi:para-aminobenzoate synthetase component 1
MATIRPVSVQVDLDVPSDRLARLVGAWEGPALLEGGPGFGEAGRWSVYTAMPRLVFRADERGWGTTVGVAESPVVAGDPLAELGRIIHRFGLAGADEAPDPDDPPFQGGLIGFFGYDLAPRLERLPRKAPRDSRLPDIRFGLYDWAVAVDHATGLARLGVYDLTGEGGLSARADRLRRTLERAAVPAPSRSRIESPPTSNFTRAEYLEAVGRALEYIRAGDIFQVNLSQRFTATGRVDPLDLYLRLRAASPAPFAAFLRDGPLAVVSASPEWFYQTRGDRVVTRPIKGTRPRGATPEEDRRLADELASSAKDRAELTMIVDLERNDLGRVCRYGTVRVVEPLAVESFAQVHHLVATVEGRLRPEAGPIDVVRAMFPGGSITGAPKIRAMQIIDELEPTRRGLYTGAVGYFGRGGASAFNIAIRTMTVEGDRVVYQVGGGIVADSDPEAEYEETLHKGRGLRAVLEGEGPP